MSPAQELAKVIRRIDSKAMRDTRGGEKEDDLMVKVF
jgi:hypothetical protein